MEIDKSKPKTLVIRFNKKTHKPAYIGTETPLENGDSIITHIAGNPKLAWIRVYVKDCDTCELYLANKCDPDKTLAMNNCPFDEEEEEK